MAWQYSQSTRGLSGLLSRYAPISSKEGYMRLYRSRQEKSYVRRPPR